MIIGCFPYLAGFCTVLENLLFSITKKTVLNAACKTVQRFMWAKKISCLKMCNIWFAWTFCWWPEVISKTSTCQQSVFPVGHMNKLCVDLYCMLHFYRNLICTWWMCKVLGCLCIPAGGEVVHPDSSKNNWILPLPGLLELYQKYILTILRVLLE